VAGTFDFGEIERCKLKAIRLALGLNQQDFADLIGVGIASLNRYERGLQKPFQKNTQAKIKKLLNSRYFKEYDEKFFEKTKQNLLQKYVQTM
jgi:transcriptional regulator with XRE-family HTH domain